VPNGPSQYRWLSKVISFVVIIIVTLLVALLIRSKMPEQKVGEAFTTCARFRDGSRLAVSSPVMIAGVRVGEVTRLSVDGAFARIDMVLVDDIDIPVDSWVTKKAYSPFGDSYIEIIPTGGEAGAPTAQRLRSGECLPRVLEGASTDRMLRAIDDVMPRVTRGLDRVHEVALYGRKWAHGTLEDKLLDADKWLREGHIEKPLANADEALARLESGAVAARDAVSNAEPRVERGFDSVENGVGAARKRIAELQVSLRDGMQNIRSGLDRVDEPVDDFAELVAAVNEGRGDDYKGTLGRLVNDPSLADSIEDATDSAREGVGSFSRFKSWLGLRTEFNIFSRQPRFYVTAEVRARTDKFYLVELERGPLGDIPDDTISDAVGVPEYYRHHVIHDGIRYTLQFGKTFGNWFQIRGGVKESTFGFGADVLMRQGRLKLSADLYGSYQYVPRLKLAGALAVFRSIYLIAGIDDVLNEPGYLPIDQGNTDVPKQFEEVRYGRDWFLGAELHFDDADLSTLLRVYGALLVGLL
jgi:phospholipid/cholesterol/gamma-HCH transport system substrate-binding protein